MVRSRHALWITLEIIGLFAFSAYRLREAIIFGPAVWQDSEGYQAVSLHGWFSWALWAGQRAPLVPVILKLSGGYDTYGVVQAVMGILAWGFLAWTASMLVSQGWRRLVIVWVVLAFATAPLVVQWDWSVLSESPSLSALAVLSACAIWIVRRFTWVRLAGLGLSALVYEGLRDSDIWYLGVVGLILLGVGLVMTMRGAAIDSKGLRRALQNNFLRARPVVSVGLVLLCVSTITGWAAAASNRNVQNIEETFYVRIFPFPDRVAWFSAHGMPEGTAVDSLAEHTPPGSSSQAKVVEPSLGDPMWNALWNWFQHDALGIYAFYLATHPLYVLLVPFDTPPLTYNNASGQLQFYDPPHRSIPLLQTIFAPNKFVVIATALVGLFIAYRRRITRRREWRLVAASVVVGLVSMLIAWHGEGQEVTRHMVEGDVQVRLGVLLVLLLSVLATIPTNEEVEHDGSKSELDLPIPLADALPREVPSDRRQIQVGPVSQRVDEKRGRPTAIESAAVDHLVLALPMVFAPELLQ